MGTIHLLCNAHLDPVWLWQWKEGAAEAVSTFRVAADFCETYDGFVFNHNEALLYAWVEEYEPELFARIQKLVSDGKWKIMGGWYLQPDCVMTSGESFLSQIQMGRAYFKEKFGITPTTAINFDPFGHSKGLVQILNKTGYDSYLFMRPYGKNQTFHWKGFAGSEVVAHRFFPAYNTLKGEAAKRIEEYMKDGFDGNVGICLWGVGNHGGGPSKLDMERIDAFIKEHPEVEILHSDAESFFREVPKDGLEEVTESLGPCMVGCYTSMVRVKQAHRALENKIAVTEKLMATTALTQGADYDETTLREAKKDLAFMEFHDVLPGSGIAGVESDGLRIANHGDEICDRLIAKHFFSLSAGQKKAKDKEIPILIYNPHPYPITGEFEVEFMLENQNWNEGEQTIAKVYNESGEFLPTQNEKPACTFNLDWMQRISFRGTLTPSGVSRFDCVLSVEEDYRMSPFAETEEEILVKTPHIEVAISKQTGRIRRYLADGKLLAENTGILEVYNDNEDPWGMTVNGFTEKIGEFTLLSDEEANAFYGYPEEKHPNVRVVENGDVRLSVEALLGWGNSKAIVTYTIPKASGYLDIHVTLFSQDVNKMIKFRLDTNIAGEAYGQTAFGTETMRAGCENVFQKWCGIVGKDGQISVLNNGIYGGSFEGSSILLSLLRTPIYAAHPIGERQIAPHNRWTPHIDMGERHFSFRITPTEHPDRDALVYNEEPVALSFFPSGDGEKPDAPIRVSNTDVLLTAMKRSGNQTILHFFNSKNENAECDVEFMGTTTHIKMMPYEIKFFTAEKNGLKETEFLG